MNHLEIARQFNDLFAASEQTIMIGGAPEPLYSASRAAKPAVIHYREDFAASALHEAAHWCIAGATRRQLDDFGYWYVPPPRTVDAQARFFAHERRVQALESFFADAAGVRFRVSADDPEVATDTFASAVAEERIRVMGELRASPATRAARFRVRLSAARSASERDESSLGLYVGAGSG